MTAAHQVSASASASDADDDEFHSLSVPGELDEASISSDEPVVPPPIHPVAHFQAAFDESIEDASNGPDNPDVDTPPDAEMRRRMLLEPEREEDVPAARWKQRPGAKYHPFVKIIAQLVFGMHLLKEGQAKSNEEVVKILQNHVNEVDAFLERTAEDFDVGIKDVEERIRHLTLPMQHMELFDTMLDEKTFRSDLISGNEKIEKIVVRTATALNSAMHDIHNGIKSTKELGTYLDRMDQIWPSDNRDIAEVFVAMRGNEQGWMSFLRELRTKGDHLRNGLVILETIIGEIARHTAAASRRNKTQGRQVSTEKQPGKTSPLRSKFTRDLSSPSHKKVGAWLNKPLPKEPGLIPGVKQALAKPHPVPSTTKFEHPRQTVPPPDTTKFEHPRQTVPPPDITISHHNPDRLGTSSQASVATSTTTKITDISDSLHNCGGLRSHPPDTCRDVRYPVRTSSRLQRQGGANPLNASNKYFPRSRSQKAAATAQASVALMRSASKQKPHKTEASATCEEVTAPAVLNSKPSQARDAFSRRLSKKKNSAPAPLLRTNETHANASASWQDILARPIDSAHSSTRESDARSSDDEQNDSEKDLSTDMQKNFEPEKDCLRSQSRGPHRLFPNVDKPLTSMQTARYHETPKTAQDILASRQRMPNPLFPSKTDRIVNFRSFLCHRKGKS